MTGPSASTEKVVILGGAIVGSFVAYFLQELGFGGQIQIVERDPTYQFSSTALSAAAIRTQFSCAINIRMSLFGADFFRNIENRFGPKADIGFHENGYLILGSPEGGRGSIRRPCHASGGRRRSPRSRPAATLGPIPLAQCRGPRFVDS